MTTRPREEAPGYARCAEPECGTILEEADVAAGERFCRRCRELVFAVRFQDGRDRDVELYHVDPSWPAEFGGPQCPSCGMSDRGYQLRTVQSGLEFYVCPDCGKPFPIVQAPAREVIF